MIFQFFVSKGAMFVIGIFAIVFIATSLTSPPNKLIPVCIVSFGVITSMSAICFKFGDLLSDSRGVNAARFSGEKFLFSSIMIVLLLLMKYIEIEINSQHLFSTTEIFDNVSDGVIRAFSAVLSAGAIAFSFNGFKTIHDELWKRMIDRNYPNKKS